MATTLLEKPLIIAGERVRTDAWLEIRSPYSGEPVGRVASGGAAEATAAIEAAARAMTDPLPTHERATILARHPQPRGVFLEAAHDGPFDALRPIRIAS